jgi:hypothetical protein
MLRKTQSVDYENSQGLLNLQEENKNRYKLKCCCLVLTHSLLAVGGFTLAVILYRRGDLNCLDGSL